MKSNEILVLLLISITSLGNAFIIQKGHVNPFMGKHMKQTTLNRQPTTTCIPSKINNDEEVRLGTKEYYAGFISRDLDEAEERITGDKVLIPTLKFVGGFTVLIGLLLVGFLVSNGII